MPQPARSLQIGGHSCTALRGGRVGHPAASSCPLRCRRANAAPRRLAGVEDVDSTTNLDEHNGFARYGEAIIQQDGTQILDGSDVAGLADHGCLGTSRTADPKAMMVRPYGGTTLGEEVPDAEGAARPMTPSPACAREVIEILNKYVRDDLGIPGVNAKATLVSKMVGLAKG